MPKKTKKSKRNHNDNHNQLPVEPTPRAQVAPEEPATSPYKFMALFFGIPTVILGAAIIVRLMGAS